MVFGEECDPNKLSARLKGRCTFPPRGTRMQRRCISLGSNPGAMLPCGGGIEKLVGGCTMSPALAVHMVPTACWSFRILGRSCLFRCPVPFLYIESGRSPWSSVPIPPHPSLGRAMVGVGVICRQRSARVGLVCSNRLKCVSR